MSFYEKIWYMHVTVQFVVRFHLSHSNYNSYKFSFVKNLHIDFANLSHYHTFSHVHILSHIGAFFVGKCSLFHRMVVRPHKQWVGLIITAVLTIGGFRNPF